MTKCVLRPAPLESERFNVRNSRLTTSAILRCSVHCTISSPAYRYRHAQLTRCFSAVAEILVFLAYVRPCVNRVDGNFHVLVTMAWLFNLAPQRSTVTYSSLWAGLYIICLQ